MFIDCLEEKIKEIKCWKKFLFVVLLVDIDRFKVLNNCFGYYIINKLIVMIVKKLKILLNYGNIVVCLSLDEFGILLENILDISDVIYIVD